MLTIKNWRVLPIGLITSAVALALLAGCTPSGPRALLQGERLMREGKYPQAILKLQTATQLLPVNAQAWNHLGLAYHKAGQANAALKTYEQARRCNQNFTPVRYNLGCLLLEQNNPQQAVAELTAYTLLEQESVEGWLKLGLAQLRSRQYDSAERSLQRALRLNGNLAQAWNGLGVIQVQHKHPKEALTSFTTALQKQPNYPPALLNLAILNHSYLNNRTVALLKYQDYLELQPPAADAPAVREVLRQLRAELTPPPRREPTNPVTSPPVVPTPVISNAAPAARVAATPAIHSATNALGSSNPVQIRPRNVVTNALASALERPPTNAKPASELPRKAEGTGRREPPGPAGATNPPENLPASRPAPASPPARADVVELADEPTPKLAQDLASPKNFTVTNTSSTSTGSTLSAQLEPAHPGLVHRSEEVSRETPPEKRRVLERLNPTTWFQGKRRMSSGQPPLETLPGIKAPSSVAAAAPGEPVSDGAPAALVQEPVRRYAYRSPAKPLPGNRRKAEPIFEDAIQAHREHRLEDAVSGYRKAIESDPSYFEAQYNLGLAAYNLKEVALSLSAFEAALSINPTSANARYNFALALQQGRYYQDAADQLRKVLEDYPEEVRAHLLLGNLYVEHLGQPALARPHYRKVLELEPQHPQATAIRYWLASGP